MKPIDLIKADLGEEVWEKCYTETIPSGAPQFVNELSPFSTSKTYVIRGRTGLFDFRTLPNGSYCVYDANARRAIRLTKDGKEIKSVIHENWSHLPNCDPVILSQLILKFFDGGTRSTHDVLLNSESLRSYGKNYVLNESEFSREEPGIETTRFIIEKDLLIIRAVTLFGWKHEKRNLGVEYIRVSPSGDVELETREVLSWKIFKSVPFIRY